MLRPDTLGYNQMCHACGQIVVRPVRQQGDNRREVGQVGCSKRVEEFTACNVRVDNYTIAVREKVRLRVVVQGAALPLAHGFLQLCHRTPSTVNASADRTRYCTSRRLRFCWTPCLCRRRR